ncbi:MAG TPA: outer membrane beta-barrel protein [Verrucomicrobiae bacterium]|nr:outer membrane beta-barrel protein [Verrucomicrobiae bacterium]
MLRWMLAVCAMGCMAVPALGQSATGMKRGITVELSGGYAYTKFNAGQGWPNANGFFGGVGLNLTNWLQIYGEGSWQAGTIPQGNTRIIGNHIGARIYDRPGSNTGMLSPFAEFLAGESRLDLNLTSVDAHFSEHGFSFKAGGGLDVKLTRHWSVRAIDADYYRTPFLESHQNNLWLSAGVVFTFGNPKYPD